MKGEYGKGQKESSGEGDLKFRKLKPDRPNEVLKLSKTAYLSYNPGRFLFGLAMFAGDDFSDETALVIDKKYYILNGDFREEYINAFKAGGVEACCNLYAERAEKFSSTWTSHSDPAVFLKGMLERITTTEETIGDKTNGK
jgi:hypothetical protein